MTLTPEFNTETVRVTWGIDTGFHGAEHKDVWEFEPGELPTDPEARTRVLDEHLREEISNHIDAYYAIEGAEK